MNTDRVNYINIALMLLAGAVAVFLPFELFLFSYIILGPLHYLTELAWLHKRQFFSPGKRDYIVLAVLSVVILFPALLHIFNAHTGNTGHTAQALHAHAAHAGRVMLFVAFAAAGIMIFIKKTWQRAVAISLAAVIGFIFRAHMLIAILFTMFIPTLIHVFVFTGAFLLLGALRGGSFSGWLSLAVFTGVAVALFFVFPHPVNTSGHSIMNAYNTGFNSLNRQLFASFLHRHVTQDVSNNSFTGILIMRFIAYAYTYHYLNWFSKTSFIKWHVMPARSLIVIVIIWLMAVALYFTSYVTGLAALYFLSILHVIFEFPLNFLTFKGIGGEVGKLHSKKTAQEFQQVK